MQVRVLGCSGAIARGCRTTSFLVDSDLLVDAGTGVGELTLEEMSAIDDVVLTHSHLDHVANLPLMLDAVAGRRTTPLRVHALPQTIAALRAHIFNNVIWPDFARIPSAESPFMQFHEFALGDCLALGSQIPKHIEVLPAVHTVPACGFAIRRADGVRHWVFSGDTERNAAFWERVNTLDVGALVIETAFSDRERLLAERSLHLSPATLASELTHIAPHQHYPIYITHTKPAETEEIMSQIDMLASNREFNFDQGGAPEPDIRWLKTDEVLRV
ncbi:MAG: 3',5'-cyclic-nucleotide phosphodiesterase [Comamonadaceae bacterium]|nr:MAG: 3',5'-cyclic-nucleotide phosphodiesterase [Comamonadaceae bacterium]